MNFDTSKKLIVISGGTSQQISAMADECIMQFHDRKVCRISADRGVGFDLAEHIGNNLEDGTLIAIHEPELHFSAQGQLSITKAIGALANLRNINVIITTHSEIVIRQLNHLIYFNREDAINSPRWAELCEMFNYGNECLLNANDVAVYTPEEQIEVDEMGFSIPLIENVLAQIRKEVCFFNDNILLENEPTT